MTRWAELEPDPRILAALDAVGPKPSVAAAQNQKKNWSKAFADRCAIAIADALRHHPDLERLDIYPTADGRRTEPLVGAVGQGQKKRIDVAVATPAAGLHLGVSLKAGNFEDPQQGHFGKNLTGRIYELRDEVNAIHSHHPHAILGCVYFFPIEACTDGRTKSTLASVLGKLRAITGRDDPLLVSQFSRLDWSGIGLYSDGSGEPRIPRGAFQILDTAESPPALGRPVVSSTLSLEDAVDRLVSFLDSTEVIDYAEPEED